jgi:hypothetical protein
VEGSPSSGNTIRTMWTKAGTELANGHQHSYDRIPAAKSSLRMASYDTLGINTPTHAPEPTAAANSLDIGGSEHKNSQSNALNHFWKAINQDTSETPSYLQPGSHRRASEGGNSPSRSHAVPSPRPPYPAPVPAHEETTLNTEQNTGPSINLDDIEVDKRVLHWGRQVQRRKQLRP